MTHSHDAGIISLWRSLLRTNTFFFWLCSFPRQQENTFVMFVFVFSYIRGPIYVLIFFFSLLISANGKSRIVDQNCRKAPLLSPEYTTNKSAAKKQETMDFFYKVIDLRWEALLTELWSNLFWFWVFFKCKRVLLFFYLALTRVRAMMSLSGNRSMKNSYQSMDKTRRVDFADHRYHA